MRTRTRDYDHPQPPSPLNSKRQKRTSDKPSHHTAPAKPLPFLPSEVLLQIVDLLATDQQLQTLAKFCSLNKSWYGVTVPKLYHLIRLDTLTSVNRFFGHFNISAPDIRIRAMQKRGVTEGMMQWISDPVLRRIILPWFIRHLDVTLDLKEVDEAGGTSLAEWDQDYSDQGQIIDCAISFHLTTFSDSKWHHPLYRECEQPELAALFAKVAPQHIRWVPFLGTPCAAYTKFTKLINRRIPSHGTDGITAALRRNTRLESHDLPFGIILDHHRLAKVIDRRRYATFYTLLDLIDHECRLLRVAAKALESPKASSGPHTQMPFLILVAITKDEERQLDARYNDYVLDPSRPEGDVGAFWTRCFREYPFNFVSGNSWKEWQESLSWELCKRWVDEEESDSGSEDEAQTRTDTVKEDPKRSLKSCCSGRDCSAEVGSLGMREHGEH